MKKILLSVYFTLHLMQLWNIGAHADEDGQNETNATASNAIARMSGVITGHDDYISAVQDDSSPSGYAIKLSDKFYDRITKYKYMVFFYAKIREQPHFRKFLWASSLCYLLSDPSPGESEVNIKNSALPRQVTGMIFTGFNKSCQVQASNSPMLSEANLYVDQAHLTLPETRNYDLIINLINAKDIYHPDTKYIFQVNTTVQILDAKNGKSLEGKSGYQCLDSKWNYWILWRTCTVLESIESMFGLAN